jgi:hypothetical protein
MMDKAEANANQAIDAGEWGATPTELLQRIHQAQQRLNEIEGRMWAQMRKELHPEPPTPTS